MSIILALLLSIACFVGIMAVAGIFYIFMLIIEPIYNWIEEGSINGNH